MQVGTNGLLSFGSSYNSFYTLSSGPVVFGFHCMRFKPYPPVY